VLSVALTGNIASGKSTVARLFQRWGATVIDADAIVRELQRPGTPVFEAIVRRFGPDMVAADGGLDRAALRGVVFRDARARADLNAIVHPAVRARRDTLIAEAGDRGVRVVVQDIPLLFETLDPAVFDLVVLVDAPPELRRERLARDRGIGAEEADRLMAAQMPPAEKRARSDIVIENDADLATLEARSLAAWHRIEKAEARPA
jgi:dephospho-CoA kinase